MKIGLVHWLILVVSVTHLGCVKEESPPSDCPVTFFFFFVIADQYGKAQPAVGCALPRQMGLGCLRKVAE